MPYSQSLPSQQSLTSWSTDVSGPSGSINPTESDILKPLSPGAIHPNYVSRIQSERFPDDVSPHPAHFYDSIEKDLNGRIVEVNALICSQLFRDKDFGFPASTEFIMRFSRSFMSSDVKISMSNFSNESQTADFLNRMISSIAKFLRDTQKSPLRPLRYFSSSNANKPLIGGESRLKPDITLVRLIEGRLRAGQLRWQDVQGLIEHTSEKRRPPRMPVTMCLKSYQTFLAQPERDFVISLAITGEGFHVVVTDHVGQIETDLIRLDTSGSPLFIRVIMGMAFLPDNLLGVDTTIIRRDLGQSDNVKFEEVYDPFPNQSNEPVDFIGGIQQPNAAVTLERAPLGYDEDISHIMVEDRRYKVIRLLFRTQTLIGRATKAFLVEAPSGVNAIVKDSWIMTDKASESAFLEGLHIPFGSSLIDSCSLRKTDYLRQFAYVVRESTLNDHRIKRRIVTSPAGVHISDFSSLWELLVALLDIVIAILYLESKNKVHRDISYTNILLREPGEDEQAYRLQLMGQLGLSEIEKHRNDLGCREGLLIDYDYGAELLEQVAVDDEKRKGKEKEMAEGPGGPDALSNSKPQAKVSGGRTGTAPFIACELLIFGGPHRVAHDLESLLYVLLFIASHLDGPCGTIRSPPLYGADSHKHPSAMREWFHSNALISLGHTKASHIVLFFESAILQHISPYFCPISPFIKTFWNMIIKPGSTPVGPTVVHSTATCLDVINIFKTVLLDPELIANAKESCSVLGKRSYPGDLIVAPLGWDAVKVTKRNLEGEPHMSVARRKRKFLDKGRK